MQWKFPAFLSYAKGDDDYYNEYIVKRLHTTISTVLRGALLRLAGAISPVVFIDEKHLPFGHLPHSIKTAIRESYALIIVVGRNYVNSDWCLKELTWFVECNGGKVDALYNRVFILMVEDAFEPPKAASQSGEQPMTVAARLDKRYSENCLGELNSFMRASLRDKYDELMDLRPGNPINVLQKIASGIVDELECILSQPAADPPATSSSQPPNELLPIFIETKDATDGAFRQVGAHLQELWEELFPESAAKFQIDPWAVQSAYLREETSPYEGVGVIVRSDDDQEHFSNKCNLVRKRMRRVVGNKLRFGPGLVALYTPPDDQAAPGASCWSMAKFKIDNGTFVPSDDDATKRNLKTFIQELNDYVRP